MTFSRTRFFPRLPWVASVVISAFLLMPMAADASATKKAGNKAKKPTATQAAERGKRLRTTEKVAAQKSVSSKTAAVNARKNAGKKAVKLVKADSRSGKRLAVARKGKSTAQATAQGRRADRAAKLARSNRSKHGVRVVAHRPASSVVGMVAEHRMSNGERLGLRSSDDPLELNSSVALVVDQQTNEVLFSKNDSAVLPIASLTKLMTGLVITDANLSMDESLTITQDDVDTFKGSRSRLAVGSTLTRGELMHLALMSSENRAAHALGRTYPGGLDHFVRLMNAKARELGMRDTRYVEPTGLSSLNQSSARDLATLVSVAYQRPILRSLSTSPSHQLELGHRTLEYKNSNRLIRDPQWEIGLQKTGYISEAGRCLVMQAKVAGRQLIMVFLDSAGKLSRAQDAERVRRWVEAQTYVPPVVVRPQG